MLVDAKSILKSRSLAFFFIMYVAMDVIIITLLNMLRNGVLVQYSYKKHGVISLTDATSYMYDT